MNNCVSIDMLQNIPFAQGILQIDSLITGKYKISSVEQLKKIAATLHDEGDILDIYMSLPEEEKEIVLMEISKHIFRHIVTTKKEARISYYLTREVEGHFNDYFYFDDYEILSKEDQKIILINFDVLLNQEYPLM